MFNPQIKINTKFSAVAFASNKNPEISAQGYVSAPSKDVVEIDNKIEPPQITNKQLLLGQITNEQIAQINKAKMLPENARFEEVYAAGGRGGLLTEPYYEINLYVPYMPTFYKETRILPKGYEVVKSVSNSGEVRAVKIKDK